MNDGSIGKAGGPLLRDLRRQMRSEREREEKGVAVVTGERIDVDSRLYIIWTKRTL